MKLTWDATGSRRYETGTKNGVLYPMTTENGAAVYGKGVAWNGLTAVTVSPEGAEPTDLWADNIKYATLRSAETLGLTIEAYTYPDEFAACDGSATPNGSAGVHVGQQKRNSFGFCFRTEIGNDTGTDTDDGYILHLIYGCTATPSEKSYESINDSPDAITFSWEVDTLPVAVTGFQPTASIEINSLECDATCLAALEDILYGTAEVEPRLPLPDEVITIMRPTTGG